MALQGSVKYGGIYLICHN